MFQKIAVFALAVAACLAQTETPKSAPEPPKFYRLDFVVKEVEGAKVVNSRSYSTSISTDAPITSVRTVNKIAFSPSPNQFQHIDVGMAIDCRSPRELQGQLGMRVSADINSVASDSPANQPLTRNNKWDASVVVPLRKPTLLFSSDDLTSKRQMQLEVTATPIR